MRKSYLAIVLTLTCLLGLGISARAQDADKMAVNVPFDFVAGGETLPAGTYSVCRVSPEAHPALFIHGYDNSVFLFPIVLDGVPANHADLSFEHVGDKYFLSKVEILAGVYAIRLPRAMTKLTQIKDPGTLTSSGTY